MKRICCMTVFLVLLITGLGHFPLCLAAQAPETGLPSALVKLPENGRAIIVEKKTQQLFLYAAEQADPLSGTPGINLVFQFPCSTGEVAGPKEKAGDKKTPEGVYFLKDEYEDRYLTPIYGKKAFPSDYPNFLDLRQGRQGSAIWIHGTDKKLVPMDSNGCVALDNKDILALAKHIQLDATPLIIVEKMTLAGLSDIERDRRALSRMLDQWMAAVSKGSYHNYLSFYAPDYLPDVTWWETWMALRAKMPGSTAKDVSGMKLEREHTGIYAHGNIYVVLTDLFLRVGKQRHFLGKRQFFVRQSPDAWQQSGDASQQSGDASQQSQDVWQIVGDLFQKRAEAFKSEEVPLVAAARNLVSGTAQKEAEEKVLKTVRHWLAAWSAKDMRRYAQFYAPNFYSDGLGKGAWVKRKKRLAKKYDRIYVTGSDFKVVRKKAECVVSFLQDYRSSTFSTIGTKQLILVNKGGSWKIFREKWKKK